jgi:maltooligosyltrehalose trehalohydrolase
MRRSETAEIPSGSRSISAPLNPGGTSGPAPIQIPLLKAHAEDMYVSDSVLSNTAKLGATVRSDGVSYRVWAADHTAMKVHVTSAEGEERELELEPAPGGYFVGHDRNGRAGDLYQYVFRDGTARPDPASRFQPKGVHGASACVSPLSYRWKSATWKRPAWKGQTIYEIHVGTFTERGTFLAAIERLDHLVDLGVEAIEIMPVADFGGDRNWGYDGVALYAPARCYGTPDDFRALVDAAHARGLLVILDVVYNHTGPNGSYLTQFSKAYYHPTHRTPWGEGFRFDGENSGPVREFFVGNATYWLDEFKIDGLRLDATHAIEDESEKHVLAEIADEVHARGGFLIAEDERNSCQVLSDEMGRGHRIDAVWSDDFHHQVRVALTGVRESYFASYEGSPEALASTLTHGWTYVGQAFPFWKNRPRGAPCRHLPPSAFVYCIENHDQVGNRALGERLEHLISAEVFRAASALLCLSPYVPLVFMGQEWAASTPFQFFTNHEGELGRLVSEGRRREFAEAGLNAGITPEQIPDPEAPETFLRSKLRWNEISQPVHAQTLELYRQLLQIRKNWIRPALDSREHWSVFVAGPAVGLRYRPEGRKEVLALFALKPGRVENAGSAPELRPPSGQTWRLALDTESPALGGTERSSGNSSWHSDEREGLSFETARALVFIAEDSECP